MGEFESATQKHPPASGADGGNGGGLAGAGGPDGLGGFGRSFLKDSVGRGGANRADDVLTASRFLHANGLLHAPTREPTEEFFRAIEAGHARLSDLSKGGIDVRPKVEPFGTAEILSQRAITSGQMKAPTPDADEAGTDAGPRTPAMRPVLPPLHTAIPARSASAGGRPVLPPPHRTIDGRPEKPKPAALPAENDNLLRRLFEIANGKRVEIDLPGPGEAARPPLDRAAILNMLQALIDNGILLGGQLMKVGTPTVVSPALEKPWELLIREKDRGA